MKRPSGLVFGFAVALLATAAIALPQSAEASSKPTPQFAVEIEWGACPPTSPSIPDGGQQCGIVKAPLDYRHPDGRVVEIAVSRISAADPALRRGVLLRPSCVLTFLHRQRGCRDAVS